MSPSAENSRTIVPKPSKMPFAAFSIDVEGERRLAEREADELEAMASEHALPTARA